MKHCISKDEKCPEYCIYEKEKIWCTCFEAKNIHQWWELQRIVSGGEHRPPGLCPQGEPIVQEIVCHSEDPCEFMVSNDGMTMYCAREGAALAVAEAAEESEGLK
jgi:hypothetical protein